MYCGVLTSDLPTEFKDLLSTMLRITPEKRMELSIEEVCNRLADCEALVKRHALIEAMQEKKQNMQSILKRVLEAHPSCQAMDVQRMREDFDSFLKHQWTGGEHMLGTFSNRSRRKLRLDPREISDMFDAAQSSANRAAPGLDKVLANILKRKAQPVSGLKWEEVGAEKPTHGRELSNQSLAAALEEGRTLFTQKELESFGITDCSDHFIKAGGSYFRPRVPSLVPKGNKDMEALESKDNSSQKRQSSLTRRNSFALQVQPADDVEILASVINEVCRMESDDRGLKFVKLEKLVQRLGKQTIRAENNVKVLLIKDFPENAGFQDKTDPYVR